jgi:bifunctional DNA primase/polymerase-like protein
MPDPRCTAQANSGTQDPTPRAHRGSYLHPDIERVALLGWHLYPGSQHSRAACFKGASEAATCDLDRLARWSRQFPNRNWRVVFGPSGLWGLDCDVPPIHEYDGVSALAALIKVHGPLPTGPHLRSGGGGVALFFRHNGQRIIGESGHPAPGIDPRRGRQSQTIPPSLHHLTGRAYRWIVPPWELAAPPAPLWLLRLVEPLPDTRHRVRRIYTSNEARKKLSHAARAIVQCTPGSRNDTLNRRAYQFGHLIAAGLIGEDETVETLYAAARASGLDHSETKATIKSGIAAGLRRGTGRR